MRQIRTAWSLSVAVICAVVINAQVAEHDDLAHAVVFSAIAMEEIQTQQRKAATATVWLGLRNSAEYPIIVCEWNRTISLVGNEGVALEGNSIVHGCTSTRSSLLILPGETAFVVVQPKIEGSVTRDAAIQAHIGLEIRKVGSNRRVSAQLERSVTVGDAVQSMQRLAEGK